MSFGLFCMVAIVLFFVAFFLLAIRAEKNQQRADLAKLSNGYHLRSTRSIERRQGGTTYRAAEGRTMGHSIKAVPLVNRAGMERASEHAWHGQHSERGNVIVAALGFIAFAIVAGLLLGNAVAGSTVLQTLSKLLAGS